MFAAVAAFVVMLPNFAAGQTSREVTLPVVADSGLYGANGRDNRGAGGRFDIGAAETALLKFDLTGVLGPHETIQSAVLQIKEGNSRLYSFDFHVVAYPMAGPWQEGIGTYDGLVGSGAFPWGPASIGDAVYLFKEVTAVGLADQYPDLVSTGWTGVTVATDGVPWDQPGARGIGTDVLDRLMVDQDWSKPLEIYSLGTPLARLNFTAEGVAILNGWADGSLENDGMAVWTPTDTLQTARCGARERLETDPDHSPELILTIVPNVNVVDLVASDPQWDRVTLTWTAPPANPETGDTAASYDIRYSTDPITESNWDAATSVANPPVPGAPGASETLLVTGLSEDTTFYFALKSTDTASQVSNLSNVASATTPVHDVTAPSGVTDLSVAARQPDRLDLQWSATGDDAMAGSASRYEVRYSTSPLTDANFAEATLVDQSLSPQPPMYMETLPVTGLSPETTYYFGVKVYDDFDNVSALSNIASGTTLSVDNSAPGTITDLAISGNDALSVRLAWTAPGNDGNTGTAAAYDVRYSTAPITDANWSDATHVPCLVPPQAAAAAENLTVYDLQPDTQYYFAVKTADAQGNISELSNVASCTTDTFPDLPVVTTMSIVEKAGVTTSNYPITLSMVFCKGDVTGNVTVRAGGLILPTQTDVKVLWPDGSIRHALVSFVIPELQADESLPIDILAGGPNYNAGSVTKDQLLASDFEASLRFTINDTHTSVSARQLLEGIASPEYWMKGDIATEFIIRDWDVNVANQLNVSYRVRVYPAAAAIRIDTVVENCWINARGNITYDAALDLGRIDPVTVFQKTDLEQYASTRWRKVFWQHPYLPQIEIRYNRSYMSRTGLIPNYDPSITVPATTVDSAYTVWSHSQHDVMDAGSVTLYFPTTGGRQEIGPYPMWTSQYLCSMDYRLAEITCTQGDLSGSIPVHYRETDPARSFYRHPVSIDDRPTIWFDWFDYSGTWPADRFPAAIGATATPWYVDRAHQPSLAYVPYLLAGDLYYLEEMHFWACYDVGCSNHEYRGGTKGWILGQVRGNAWALRNLVDAAVLTPVSMPEKSYLDDKIANNIEKYESMYYGMDYPTVRTYGTSNYVDQSTIDQTTCSYASGPWQDDFLTWSFVHAFRLGYPTLDLVHWGGKGLIDRFTDWPGWNRFRGMPYALPVKGKDASGNAVPYLTWADVNNGFVDKVGPTGWDGGIGSDDNRYHARGVLALVSNFGNGPAAFGWIDSQVPVSSGSSDPRWAFAPVFKAADIDFDGNVNVGDLQALAVAWATHHGDAGYNAAADLTADTYVNVGDLQMLVANWDQ